MLFGSDNSLLDTILASDPVRFDLLWSFLKSTKCLRRVVCGCPRRRCLDYIWWRMGNLPPKKPLPELIDDGETGFLMPYLDLSAVLDRFGFFVADPAKITEFGEAARRRSLQHFSCDVFANRISALYEQLIAEAQHRC